jgi:UDP-2,3-diacylglucosamine pyrophosphatase LpxH
MLDTPRHPEQIESMRKDVRWLHISDIHFGEKSKLDQRDAFIRIRSDVLTRKAAGKGPDLVFVTGDITHSGLGSEFSEVSNLLGELCIACGLPRDRMFFCPGNHDSNISIAPTLVQGCRTSFHDLAAFPRFLEGAEYPALKNRQAEYRSFVRRFRGDSGGFDKDDLHAVAELELDDVKIGILSINSSLLASGGPLDLGRLQVCVRSLEERCKEITRSHLVFALVHHPFEWLTTFEADRAESLVFDSADILLRGHLHKPKLSTSLRNIVVSASGALWENRAADYEYTFGFLPFDTLLCEIESVRFLQKTGKWTSTTENAPISRNLDEQIIPRTVREHLGSPIMFPAQIASFLAGYTGDLMMTNSRGSAYFPPEKICTESLRAGISAMPALGVIRIYKLLAFYGPSLVPAILATEQDALSAYDNALQVAAASDPAFAGAISSREAEAERLMRNASVDTQPWASKLLARLVSEGATDQISALPDGDGAVIVDLKSALSAGSRDPYEAWLSLNGPCLSFPELVTVATRLAVKGTADLAAIALHEATIRFPIESRRLDALAKTIASELADPQTYVAFKRALEPS